MSIMHVNPEEAVKIHQDLHARYSVAMHWGTFILTDEPLDEPPHTAGRGTRCAAGVSPEEFFLMKHGETRKLAPMFRPAPAAAPMARASEVRQMMPARQAAHSGYRRPRTTSRRRDQRDAGARSWAFQQIGVADVELGEAEARLLDWLARGFHGDMHYLERHGTRRSRPAELVPGTLRVISCAARLLAAGRAGQRSGAGGRQAARTCRAMPWGATITESCAAGCSSWPIASSRRSESSAIACSPTARR